MQVSARGDPSVLRLEAPSHFNLFLMRKLRLEQNRANTRTLEASESAQALKQTGPIPARVGVATLPNAPPTSPWERSVTSAASSARGHLVPLYPRVLLAGPLDVVAPVHGVNNYSGPAVSADSRRFLASNEKRGEHSPRSLGAYSLNEMPGSWGINTSIDGVR